MRRRNSAVRSLRQRFLVNDHQRRLFAAISAVVISMVLCQTTYSDEGPKAPPHVFVDVGACPFECCTYRQWTTKKSTSLFDRPRGRQVVATLSEGDVVQGMTGEVISTPIAVKADRDIAETPIKAGDR